MKHCQMHPNTTRRTKTWVLGPIGWIDFVHCEKFRCDFVEPTFALVALVQPVSYRASCSNKTIQNAYKHYETHQNMSLGPNGVDRVHSLRKNLMPLRGTNFALIPPVQPVLHQASCSNETIQNAPKHYETDQNISLGSNGMDWVRSLRRIPMRLHGTNFCINCTISTRFAPSFVY